MIWSKWSGIMIYKKKYDMQIPSAWYDNLRKKSGPGWQLANCLVLANTLIQYGSMVGCLTCTWSGGSHCLCLIHTSPGHKKLVFTHRVGSWDKMPIHIYLLFPKESFEIRGLAGTSATFRGCWVWHCVQKAKFLPTNGRRQDSLLWCVLVCEGGKSFYIVCSVSYIIYAL